MNEKFNLEFNVFELNTLIKGLKELPYKESSKLIDFVQVEYEKQAIELDKARKAEEKKAREAEAKEKS